MKKQDTLALFEKIENDRKTVKEIQDSINYELLDYRIKSVYRVLDYLHSKSFGKEVDMRELNTLITHCCNKLNGNIDGTELSLDNKE